MALTLEQKQRLQNTYRESMSKLWLNGLKLVLMQINLAGGISHCSYLSL